MKQYQYLLFDADNTLLDFSKAEALAFEETCKAAGIPFSESLYCTYSEINDGLWKKLERHEITLEALKLERFRLLLVYLGREDLDTAAFLRDSYIEFLGKQSCIISGADTVCRTLSKEYRMFIVTNGISRIQRSRFGGSPLLPFFENVFVSEEMGVQKPDPAYFDRVIREIGDPDRSRYLVIGDSLTSDCDGAIAAGIDICRYNPKGLPDNGRNLTYTVKTLEELLPILQTEA